MFQPRKEKRKGEREGRRDGGTHKQKGRIYGENMTAMKQVFKNIRICLD
jgi:hypothetical protein